MSHPTKYDVFLSFRGEDTRDKFTGYLYAELRRKKIETFIDNRLGRGEEISPALYKAIEESKIYVVILSEHYASSGWCLAELTKILKCKEKYGREVIPIFYEVDPSDVRHQTGSYAKDFLEHHQHRSKDKIDAWKAALTQVANLSGWDSPKTRPESRLVTEIVKDILKKLNHCFLINYDGMIGIEKHVEQIQSLLLLESAPVRTIGICGMGGLGKSTIANAIYRKLIPDFNCGSIILNVQHEIEKGGLQEVRKKYVSQLLGEDITSSGFNFLFNPRLEREKVLIVLDDLKDSDQLKDLIGTHGYFGEGSRIIVTSRDNQVLQNANADEIYQVREMDFQDSLQLFCLNAFKQNYPMETYVSLLEKVLNYAKGVPLTLKVLGKFLQGRTKIIWESALQNLEKFPHSETFKVLKLSYDGLEDEQKDIFLDIACFYRGHLENVVAQTLDCCGFSANIGMEVLKDRCLISISEGRIVMHDLIYEMGQGIVRQECANDPGKRSRLWKHEEIHDILKKNKGTDAIKCIFLDICKINKVQPHAETFKKMHNLRMIQFYNSSAFQRHSNVILNAPLKSFPDDLKFLRWDGFPQRSLPLDFCPENLVTLDMPHSHLEQLWVGDQALPNLKRLNLSYSQKLIAVPDFSLSPNIEEIILSHCSSLEKVNSSSFLDNLNCLCLNGCIKLKSLNLPSNILSRSSGLVVLHGCLNLKTLIINSGTEVVQSNSCSHFDVFWDYEAIYVSDDDVDEEEEEGELDQCQCRHQIAYEEYSPFPIDNVDIYENEEPVDNICLINMKVRIDTMPSLFTGINHLCWLDISNCESLTCLPSELFNLNFLRRLYLGGCLNLKALPEIQESKENLTVLILDKTAIKELPSSLHRLVVLEELSLQMCTRLKTIPSSIGSLSKLLKLNLTCCESLETFPSSIFKLKLTKLDLQGCSMLKTFPEILEPAESFVHINLTKTAIQHLPSSLEYLVGLKTLSLNLCSNLVSLPNSISKLNLLSVLDCSGCCKLTKIPNNIGSLSSLTELSLQESSIMNLPESISHLSSLKSLDLSDCKWLECIPELPPHLNQFLAFDCSSINRVVPNSRSKLLSDSKEGTFKFHFTNSQQLDETSWKNIGFEAWTKITNDAYRSVFFSFPGSAVPSWLPYRCQGRSVTMEKNSPFFLGENRLVGFVLCVVFRGIDMEDTETRDSRFVYTLTFESNGKTLKLPGYQLRNSFNWKRQHRYSVQDHTFLWKYQFDFTRLGNKLFHAHNFTFKIHDYYKSHPSNFRSTETVKECGICPLYTIQSDEMV